MKLPGMYKNYNQYKKSKTSKNLRSHPVSVTQTPKQRYTMTRHINTIGIHGPWVNQPYATNLLMTPSIKKMAYVTRHHRHRVDDLNLPGARKMGQGAFGSAYLLPDTSCHAIQKMPSLKILQSGPWKVQGPCILKFQTAKEDLEFDVAAHEASMQYILSQKSTCAPNPFCPGEFAQRICTSRFVPRLYWTGFEGLTATLVTCMELAVGKEMTHVLNNLAYIGKPIPAELYLATEKAVVSLWLNGFAHGDLHTSNIMVDTTSILSVKLIDFGFVVMLPKHVTESIAKNLKGEESSPQSLADIAWFRKGTAKNHVNKVLRGRGYDAYNSDGKFLRIIWNKMDSEQRTRIPTLRPSFWGCVSPFQMTPRRTSTPARMHNRSSNNTGSTGSTGSTVQTYVSARSRHT